MVVNTIYKVKRSGNDKNPKLVILLLNPGGDPDYPKRLDEYGMDRDGLYKDSDMSLRYFREYSKWWDDILFITDKYVKDTDVLALESYPYHSRGGTGVPPYKEWDNYAKSALEENVSILKESIAKNIPIFIYYRSLWFGKAPELKTYANTNLNKSSQWRHKKLKELELWLQNLKSQNKI
ncbi:MAG: hypothetical protein FWC51_02680 [Proteobacteria bacterium]|nr:hypothetical protein [Pseudomonadota bacterium]